MNKKLGLIIVGVVVVVTLGAVVFKMAQTTKPAVRNKTAQTKTAVPSANNTETIQGTIKSLISSSKSITCTYTHQINTTTVNGKVYVAAGKMRGDFASINSANKESVNSHVIISDTQNGYAWTDLTNRGLKIPLTANTSTISKNGRPDLNQQEQFSCHGWNPDPSVFIIPSNVTFYPYNPGVQPNGQATNSAQ